MNLGIAGGGGLGTQQEVHRYEYLEDIHKYTSCFVMGAVCCRSWSRY